MGPRPRRLRPDKRRVLELLAACRDGSTEAILQSVGVSGAQIVQLVRVGLVTVKPERVIARGKTIKVRRVRITDAGRGALKRAQ